MALFRAVPTVARCSLRVLFPFNTLTNASFTKCTRQANFGGDKRRISHGEKSRLEQQLKERDDSKRASFLLQTFLQRGPNVLRRKLILLLAGVFVGASLVQFADNEKKRAGFLPCRLVAKEPVSTTGSIFYLEPNHRDYEHWQLHALFNGIVYYLDYAYKAEETDKLRKAWKTGAVWNVEFRQPQLQILRPYTPLPPSDVDGKERKGCLKFFIRNEPKGEMSSYLHSLAKNAEVSVRGPNYDFRSGPDVRQIVYFAGGTGIAPALQVAHALLGDTKTNRTVDPAQLATRKLHILWASRKRSDCQGGFNDTSPRLPNVRQSESKSQFRLKANLLTSISNLWIGKEQPRPPPILQPVPPSILAEDKVTPHDKSFLVRELEALKEKYPNQVAVEYFVDEENTWIDQDTVSKALARLQAADAPTDGQSEVLVSGPPGFISNLAGPKEMQHGIEEQGALGGLISTALSKAPQDVKVWKL
ncbi:uncharacterized protein A1O9_02878 [Exophiala aquamarina CBS 119918]|uniref:FAD-binding FR-type domain-containing protein n=1 Tax=Exophiala aquamarina CBS 119918 TaxID=1182545 RepID=A0A072PPS2_9EURO|nr:uncharacterized protein A1O9_02878 [Exophiala aquamarina CBS 119918]KEF61313.1 hypothetical protein A1O9_02878 [Exophiala aquamarina CBS 119918]